VNISFLNCEGEAMTVEMSLKGVYLSSGSACTSRILEPSHVLLALKRKYEEAHGSVLMKTTPFLTVSDIEYVLTCFPEAVQRIRSISPFRGG
jgi:cysteine desulfurase